MKQQTYLLFALLLTVSGLLNAQTHRYIAIMTDKASVEASRNIHGKNAKANFVAQQLQAVAKTSQASLINWFETNSINYHSFYVVNAVRFTATDAQAAQVAARPDVARVLSDEVTYRSERFFTEREPVGGLRGGGNLPVEWGIAKIKADSVHALGFLGQGVVIGGQDTGYDWTHPQLVNSYRGWNGTTADHNYNWHDAIHAINPINYDTLGNPTANPCGVDSPFPCDDGSHGTHTMGTMAGAPDTISEIGVAPGSKWMACRNMERGWGNPSSYIECFEFFLSPTDLNGQNPNPAMAPHVINNSWYCSEQEGCDTSHIMMYNDAVNNLRAAGTVVVVSAGNDGPGCSSISHLPSILENSFDVAAIAGNDTIAWFSSRGPVTLDGSNRLKPNITAPGVWVRSCVPDSSSAFYSGTSMAGPHVAGAVALLISAVPALAGEVELIEDILEITATPYFSADTCGTTPGTAHPNQTYGYGLINILAAINYAQQLDLVDLVDAEHFFSVRPNPSTSQTTVYTTMPGTLRIFSISGSLITEKEINEELTLDTTDWPVGVNLIQIQSGSRVDNIRFLKIY